LLKSVFTYYGSFNRGMCFSCVSIAFSKHNRYTNLVQEQFVEKFSETPVPHHSKICSVSWSPTHA